MAERPRSIDDRERLKALDSYDILDTPAEAGFDDIVLLACQICDTPVALVSLVAGDRQWFKARVGFDPCQTPLEQSVCWHALKRPGLLIIPDLTADPRTRDNTLVTGEPFLRFYAGARLETPEGIAIGTLCVIDAKPRPGGLTEAQATALQALARQVMTQMELRRTAAARDIATRTVREVEARHRQIVESAVDFAIIATDLQGRITDWNAGAEKIFGWSAPEMIGGPADRFFTPEDRAIDRVGHEMRRAVEAGRGNDERWHLRKDGSRFYANGEMMPLRSDDGEHLGFIKIVRDETRRRESADALATASERLDLALGASGMVGIWDWDIKAGLIHADANFARTYTVDPEWAARGAPLDEYIKNFHPEDMPGFQAELDRLFAGADEFTNEYRIIQPDGSVKWLLARGRLVRDAGGDPVRFPGASVDITERKQAEERANALLHLGDRLRDMDDPGEMAFVAAEVMGRALGGIRAGYGVVDGRSETVVVGRDWTVRGSASVAGDHAFRTFGSYIDDLKAGATVAIGDVRLDGRTAATADALEALGMCSILNVPVFEHGRFVAVFFVHCAEIRPWGDEQVAFARNVADRTRSAIERRIAEIRVQALNDDLERRVDERTRERNRLWENTNDLMATAGLDGFLKEVNPAWTTVLGWSEHDLLSRPFLEIVNPADHPETVKVLERLAAGQPVSGFLDRVLCRDGGERSVMWTAVPDGAIFYIVGRDLTEQRSMEEQLRQSQKMEAIGQLTGGVAHDFNNLLTVIRSSVDLLKRPSLAEDRRQRYIDAISDTTNRAAKLTGQLLAFARRQTLKPEVFDVAQSMRMLRDVMVTLTGSRIRVATDMPDRCFFVNADASQFDTALVNLSVNARDAMEGEGTLTITVAAAKRIPPLRTHPEIPGDFVTVSVTDTGSGIAPEAIDHIFEPFFTTKAVGQGTGLGLSQVFGFVKQSGGEVMVTSRVGQGTTFTLFLPEVRQERHEAQVEHEVESVDGHGTCVLVVEDNEQVGRFAVQTLQELGYHSTLAIDGPAALAELAINAGWYDVVFSDVIMPGMSGIELAQEIRRRHADLPVVLTSGYSHVLAQNGTYGFELLHKPYSIEQLSRILSKAAHWRRSKRLA